MQFVVTHFLHISSPRRGRQLMDALRYFCGRPFNRRISPPPTDYYSQLFSISAASLPSLPPSLRGHHSNILVIYHRIFTDDVSLLFKLIRLPCVCYHTEPIHKSLQALYQAILEDVRSAFREVSLDVHKISNVLNVKLLKKDNTNRIFKGYLVFIMTWRRSFW